MFVVSVVCCQVEVSASGRSLVQRSPTECGVSNERVMTRNRVEAPPQKKEIYIYIYRV